MTFQTTLTDQILKDAKEIEQIISIIMKCGSFAFINQEKVIAAFRKSSK